MPATLSTVQNPPSTQAIELCLLVDLEARWENLRVYESSVPKTESTLKELHQKQKAYETFFAKLVAYNKAHKPAHVPELLLNNALRLGIWCRRMRELHARVQSEPQVHYPTHLLEKAYRWADRLADRLGKDRATRIAAGNNNLVAAVRALDELAQWCDSLTPAERQAS